MLYFVVVVVFLTGLTVRVVINMCTMNEYRTMNEYISKIGVKKLFHDQRLIIIGLNNFASVLSEAQ
jgi:hypothetical protein